MQYEKIPTVTYDVPSVKDLEAEIESISGQLQRLASVRDALARVGDLGIEVQTSNMYVELDAAQGRLEEQLASLKKRARSVQVKDMHGWALCVGDKVWLEPGHILAKVTALVPRQRPAVAVMRASGATEGELWFADACIRN
jgi:hypothetical protein